MELTVQQCNDCISEMCLLMGKTREESKNNLIIRQLLDIIEKKESLELAKEKLYGAMASVSGDNDLEMVFVDRDNPELSGWYAYQYDGCQSYPIYGTKYEKEPLFGLKEKGIRKIFNECHVAFCG